MPRGMLLGAAGLGAGCVLAVLAVTLPRSQAAFWPLFASAEFAVFLVMVRAGCYRCCPVPPSPLVTYACVLQQRWWLYKVALC